MSLQGLPHKVKNEVNEMLAGEHRALGGPVACFMNVFDGCSCDPN
jgi:hypothetical protein